MLKRFSTGDDFGACYREHGCVVLVDLFRAGELRQIERDILDLWRSRFPRLASRASRGEVLGRHYRDRRTAWRECARHVWDVFSVQRFATAPQLSRVLERAGLRHAVLSTRPEPRIDMPGDAEYMQPWHQDWRYSQTSLNAVTFWTPLHRVAASDGAIAVLPGSHRWGVLDCTMLTSPRRFQVVDPRIAETTPIVAELEIGETLLFSQLIVHRSGFNASGKPRLTVQLRCADFADAHWRANGYCVPATSDLVWRRLPSPAAVKRVFRP